jgi:hypothetical protein
MNALNQAATDLEIESVKFILFFWRNKKIIFSYFLFYVIKIILRLSMLY